MQAPNRRTVVAEKTPSNRVALVTGSATGLMRGVCVSLARRGYAIAANYRPSRGHADETVEAVRAERVPVAAFPADVSVPAEAAALVAATFGRFGRVDVLACGAGPLLIKDLFETTVDDFYAMVAGNLGSVFYCAKAVLPLMRDQGKGRIIGFAMTGSETTAGWRHMGAHAAAKSGMVALLRSLALEEASFGITCNAIAVGDIRQKKIDRREALRRRDPSNPTRRSGSWEDVGDAVAYLASDEASYVNGAVLPVNGGWQGFLHKHAAWT
ncbi:MAG: SDR family oxidoreductase [Candidatus Eremiobacteraeota bacterium]|nr:SDR family oxidoreductase [Candidatus Eremiobacteraeota bacterium]MBC5827334.1 SDR family oxidoreductase [Candidatus Eremiobacteraeota bacterium]